MLVRARQPQGGRPERGSSLHQHSSGRTRERPAIQRADYEPNRSCAPHPSPSCSVMTELRRSGPLREPPPPGGRPPLAGPGTVTRPLLIAPEYTAREENVARRFAFRSGASNRPPDPTCGCRGPTRSLVDSSLNGEGGGGSGCVAHFAFRGFGAFSFTPGSSPFVKTMPAASSAS